MNKVPPRPLTPEWPMETMDSSGDNYADNVPDNALLLPHTGLRIDLRGVTPSTPPPEQRLGNSSPSTSQEFFSRKHAYAATLILGWYILSTAINIFNKWFFGASSYHYPYPIFVTSCHMLFHSIISFFVLAFIWPSWRPTKIMSVSDYFTKIVPCAASAGMDIALTNASLQFITLSFATMIKSAVPIAVLLFSFAFGLERPRPQLIVIICVIAAGSSLMVFGELKFHVVGFIEAFVATVSSGLRWTLTHLLLAKDELGIANPVATNLYLAPAMAICMLSVGLMIEGLPRMADKGPELFLYVFSSGFLAWGLVMFEYGIVMTAGALTFSVAGIFKEILTISVSHAVFEDPLQAINIVGLVISLLGIVGYNFVRMSGHGGK